ncbi:UNVERIFIED_CONTAM: hypothetical protein Sangu_3149600 [Sesamum angustifolium]|uniref:Uncharacterized protein n=1 Tax=Sesamum angustifolium TaxID=2727405 RepID=A0AAW2K1V5_9LAMI
MNTKSRAGNGNAGVGDLEGISEHIPQEEAQQLFGLNRDEVHRRPERAGGAGASSPSPYDPAHA